MSMIFSLLAQLVSFYTFILLIRVLLTWIPNLDPENPLVQVLRQITDPVLEPARQVIPAIGMVDISPIVVFIALRFVATALENVARSLA